MVAEWTGATEVSVRFAASEASYYVLLAGTDLERLERPVDMGFGHSGTAVLRDRNAVDRHRFYRVGTFPRGCPQDMDGDGMDDVYELSNRGFLDPLDPLDAASTFAESGRSNLDEYRVRHASGFSAVELMRYLADVMGVDRETFWLAQGSLSPGATDSSVLFELADSVPPASVGRIFDAGGTTRFSSVYEMLLGALLPTTYSRLAVALGDDYANWLRFLREYAWADAPQGTTQRDVFREFAAMALDPSVAQRGLAIFDFAAQEPLGLAREAFAAPENSQAFARAGGGLINLKKYEQTIDEVLRALDRGRSVRLGFGTRLEETAVAAHTGASPSGAPGGCLTVSGYINKYATVAVRPGNWFSASQYRRAYQGRDDNSVWDPDASAGSWGSFFGQPDGGLARRVTQLVLVSDYEIKFTVPGRASAVLSRLREHAVFAEGGPFSLRKGRLRETRAVLGSDSRPQTEVTYRLGKGLVEIMGVTVATAPE